MSLAGGISAVGSDSNLSRDGRFAAIVKTPATHRDIWSVDLARGSATRLSFTGISNDSPLWSPDGKRVVYRGPGGIYMKEANGAGAEQILIAGAGRSPRSLSPDGQQLLVNENFKRCKIVVATRSSILAGESSVT